MKNTKNIAKLVLSAVIVTATYSFAADEHDSKVQPNGKGRTLEQMKAYGPVITEIERQGQKTKSQEATSDIKLKNGDTEVVIKADKNKLFSDFFSQAETFREGLNACSGDSEVAGVRKLLDHCLMNEIGGIFFDPQKFSSSDDGKSTAFTGTVRSGTELPFKAESMKACFGSLSWMLTKRAKDTELEKGLQDSLKGLSEVLFEKNILEGLTKEETIEWLSKPGLEDLAALQKAAMTSKGLAKCEIKPASSSGGGTDDTLDGDTNKDGVDDKDKPEQKPDGNAGAGGARPGENAPGGVNQAQPGLGNQQFAGLNNGLGGFGNQFPVDQNLLGNDQGRSGLEEILANALDQNDEQPQVVVPPASNSRGGNQAPAPGAPVQIPPISIPPSSKGGGEPPVTPQAENPYAGMDPRMMMMNPYGQQSAPQPTPPPYLASREKEPTPVARRTEAEILEEARAKAKSEMEMQMMQQRLAQAQQQQQAPVSQVRNAQRLGAVGGAGTAAKGKSASTVSRPSTRKTATTASKASSANSKRSQNTRTMAFKGTGSKMNTVNGKGQVKDGKVGAKAVR